MRFVAVFGIILSLSGCMGNLSPEQKMLLAQQILQNQAASRQTFQPIQLAPVQTYPTHSNVNCTTNYVGNFAYTNCY